MEDRLPELPKGWVRARLEDISEINSGYGFPLIYQGKDYGEIPFFKVGDISKTILSGNVYLKEADNYVSREDCKKLKANPLKAGNIVFAKIGEAIKLNRRAILSQESLVDNNVMGIFPILQIANNLFAYYFLQTIKLGDLSRATTVPSIRKSDVEQIHFPLPPLPEQHRIVAKIEELFTKLDAGIEALKKIKAQLKRYRQAVLKYAFEGKLTEEWRKNVGAYGNPPIEPASALLERIKEQRKKEAKGKYKEMHLVDTSELPELPEGWVWSRIGDISGTIHYGYTASAEADQVGPKILRITDIQDNSVDWESVPYCRIGDSEKGKYLLKEGDLVFARTGATVGKSFLIRGKIPETVFASYLIRIILEKNIDRAYVYDFFQSNYYWSQIHKGKLGIGQPNVNAQVLSKIYIPLPSFHEQNKIVEEIETRLSVADEVEKVVEQSFKQSGRLRQSILKQAFGGKLVPQDPSDEPAERLLERIKIEKTKLANESKIKSVWRKRHD